MTDEETGVPKDRADDEGGQTHGYRHQQEQEDGQAASFPVYTTGILYYKLLLLIFQTVPYKDILLYSLKVSINSV